MKKLYTLSEVLPRGNRYDSVKTRRAENPPGVNYTLLTRCERAWDNLRNVRETRERVRNYCYGDQWSDLTVYQGERMTEREYIRRRGNVPLTNNIMISTLSTIVGVYAKQNSEPQAFAREHDAQDLSDMMTATMQANWQDTGMNDLLKKIFEDALCGGVSIVRETWEERDEVEDSYTDYVNPSYAFWEGGDDPRHTDLNLIGQLHDLSPEDLFALFAKKEYGQTVESLCKIFGLQYTEGGRSRYGWDMYENSGIQTNDLHQDANISFDIPSDRRKVRVIEVWTKETKQRLQCYDPISTDADGSYYRMELSDKGYIDRQNAERRMMYEQLGVAEEERAYIDYEPIVDRYWWYTYMAPDGTVLCEGETPYDFKTHPYTMKLYPFVNGEIHPFMGNILDQQRYINRLIVMHDMAARSSAKGITIVPVDSIPDNMTPEDFADQFTQYDGLVFYDTSRVNPSARPEVITSNAVQIGTTELLNLEMSLVHDITNVSGALQGKTPSSGTSASRYAMETQNSTTSLFSVLSDQTTFMENIAKKKCYMIQQFYPDGRLIYNKDNTDVIEYRRLPARDVMFKVSIKESASTVAFQSTVNDRLKELLAMKAINVIQYLRNCNEPYAKGLLQDLLREQQEMQAQQAALQQQAAMAQGGGAPVQGGEVPALQDVDGNQIATRKNMEAEQVLRSGLGTTDVSE